MIVVTPLRVAVDYTEPRTFFACSKIIKMQNGTTAKFLYPSPYILNNSDFGNLNVDCLYCIANENAAALALAGFDTNRGRNNNPEALPEECWPPHDYFSDWKDNPKRAIFWYDFQELYHNQAIHGAQREIPDNN